MGGLKHVASTLRPLGKGLSRALEDSPVASSLCLGCASGCVGEECRRLRAPRGDDFVSRAVSGVVVVVAADRDLVGEGERDDDAAV